MFRDCFLALTFQYRMCGRKFSLLSLMFLSYTNYPADLDRCIGIILLISRDCYPYNTLFASVWYPVSGPDLASGTQCPQRSIWCMKSSTKMSWYITLELGDLSKTRDKDLFLLIRHRGVCRRSPGLRET
jgi:hypothetical protein